MKQTLRALKVRAARLRGRLADDRRGNVAVLFALTTPLTLAGAAFGVETTYWYHKQQRLQTAADAAAYAGAIEKRAGSSPEQVQAAALIEAAKNGFDASTGTLQVGTPADASQAIQVVASGTAKRVFTSWFYDAPVQLRSEARADFQSPSSACVLALDPSAAAAAHFGGSSNLLLQGCNVMANSISSSAVSVDGSARLTTPCIISVGGVSLSAGATQTECPRAIVNAPLAADPYRGVPQPATNGACMPTGGAVLNPGRYCSGLSVSGTVRMNPGVYVITGGTFKVNANANLTGDGVTVFVGSGARMSFNGNATIQLSAPTTGTYSGLLFMGDRNSTGGARNSFNGTAGSKFTGAIYFPTQAVEYLGNFSGEQGCMQVVANTVEWTGNTSMSIDCRAYGMRNVSVLSVVRLSR